MAYRKFNCACGCNEMVQLQGAFVRGHRAPAMQKAREEAQVESQITITKLEKLLTPKKAAAPEPPPEPAPDTQGSRVDGGETVDATVIEGSRVEAVKHEDNAVTSGLNISPPAYPESIDRRRWRLAAERPATNPSSPWIETKCHSCLLPMWTRDPLSTWEHGGLCEEDDYILRSELGTHERRQFQHQARTYHDPFRSR